jgi:hypothetical protein
VRALVDQGSDRWLEADHLLFNGIEAFGELRYPEAVKALRSSLELSQLTYREYADVQGPRRVRDTCVYLGLARLEQGEAEDAAAWFQRAARTDPAWTPDEKQFSPAARKAWADARESLSGAPMETSLERLGPLADTIGADVIVTGGVNVAHDGKTAVQLVIADRRRGEANEQSIAAREPKRDALISAVDQEMPQLVARILGRPVLSPESRARRVRYDAGLEMRMIPGSKLETLAITNRYRWNGTIQAAGIAAGINAPLSARTSLSAGVTIFPEQVQRSGTFTLHPAGPSLALQTGLGVHAYLLPALSRARWTLAAGPGVEGTYAIFVFRSSSSVAPVVPSWFGPAFLATARRDLGTSAFVQLRAGAEWDFGSPPAPLTFRAQVVAGTAF